MRCIICYIRVKHFLTTSEWSSIFSPFLKFMSIPYNVSILYLFDFNTRECYWHFLLRAYPKYCLNTHHQPTMSDGKKMTFYVKFRYEIWHELVNVILERKTNKVKRNNTLDLIFIELWIVMTTSLLRRQSVTTALLTLPECPLHSGVWELFTWWPLSFQPL